MRLAHQQQEALKGRSVYADSICDRCGKFSGRFATRAAVRPANGVRRFAAMERKRLKRDR